MSTTRIVDAEDVLVPKLTAFDRKVLRALPTPNEGPILTAWTLGMRLDHADVRELVLVLKGLAHLGLVWSRYSTVDGVRGRREAWSLTRAGAEASTTATAHSSGGRSTHERSTSSDRQDGGSTSG